MACLRPGEVDALQESPFGGIVTVCPESGQAVTVPREALGLATGCGYINWLVFLCPGCGGYHRTGDNALLDVSH